MSTRTAANRLRTAAMGKITKTQLAQGGRTTVHVALRLISATAILAAIAIGAAGYLVLVDHGARMEHIGEDAVAGAILALIFGFIGAVVRLVLTNKVETPTVSDCVMVGATGMTVIGASTNLSLLTAWLIALTAAALAWFIDHTITNHHRAKTDVRKDNNPTEGATLANT